MTTRDTYDQNTTPMTANSTNRPRSSVMHLLNEALSRARMRSPQNANSEARRSARRVAMQARHNQARELGDLSQLMLR
jgi:hypothetical protein